MLILALHSGWVVYTSNYSDSVGSEMFRVFVANYVGISIALFALGGLLAWFTDKGKIWAKWTFIGYCTYRAADSIWGVYLREGMNPSQTDISDWAKAHYSL